MGWLNLKLSLIQYMTRGTNKEMDSTLYSPVPNSIRRSLDYSSEHLTMSEPTLELKASSETSLQALRGCGAWEGCGTEPTSPSTSQGGMISTRTLKVRAYF